MTQLPNRKVIAKAMQDSSNKFDMSKRVIATQDFGYMLPVECKLVLPGDKFDINVSQFTRLMPLPAPTFGKIECVTRAFFVPMHQLFKDWENFISNRKTPMRANFESSGESVAQAQVPCMTVLQLSNIFLTNTNLCTFVTTRTKDSYEDFEELDVDIISVEVGSCLTNTGSTAEDILYAGWKVTPLGRKLLTVLNSIGYNFPWISCYTVSETSGAVAITPETTPNHIVVSKFKEQDLDYVSFADTVVSALPLIAFWKFYLDWCVPSRYIRSGFIKLYNLLDLLYKQDTQCFYGGDSASGERRILSNYSIIRLLDNPPLSFFSDDYFSQSFKNPFGYEDSLSNSLYISNPADQFDNDNAFNPAQVDADGTSPSLDISEGYINQFALSSLGALQDLVNRGKLAGYKIQDYLRVTYGFTPSNDAMNVSTYLGSHRFDIQIGDVMSNADTKSGSDGAYLGEYAGRGLGGNTCHFEFDSKEHGFFFITSELYVRPSYVQGLRPEVTSITRADYFQPEFDNMGCDPVYMRELVFTPLDYKPKDRKDVSFPSLSDVDIFGMSPRYSRLKTNFDSVIGDFRLGRVNTGLDSWYISRMFSESNALQWQDGINYLFSQQAGADGLQNYDRIFQVANASIDHFYSVFNLDFTAYRHMKSLVEPFEVDENHGSNVEVSQQGVV